jgi:hypothetical protein
VNAAAFSVNAEDENSGAGGGLVRRRKILQRPGIVEAATLTERGCNEHTNQKKIDAQKLGKGMHHQGATTGHKRIREQCGTVIPTGQTCALIGSPSLP